MSSAEPTVWDQDIEGTISWTGDTLPEDAGCVEISEACRAELDSLVAELSGNPLPLPALRPDDFDLPESRKLMAAARRWPAR